MAEKGEGDVENVEQLQRDPSDGEEIGQAETHTHDAVFGEITEGGPNYRSVCCPETVNKVVCAN